MNRSFPAAAARFDGVQEVDRAAPRLSGGGPAAIPFAGVARGLGRLGPLVGRSPAMRALYGLIVRGAPTTAAILISGETGTGKELVAATVHDLSPRARGPFRALNCGAVAPQLAESELFGHERGSFTGADRQHKGWFEQADRGTLFLDEVAEMPRELQAKLLRVLERGTITRVGGSESIPVDVRVIAATNRPPKEAVASGRLREDLFYRLDVFPIHVPPLRDRQGDVELLADHFLAKLNAAAGTALPLSVAFRGHLALYPWPGNVRELRNFVERAFILAEGALDVHDWPTPVARLAAGPVVPAGATIAEMERVLILAALERLGGDKKLAAAALGISAKTIHSRLRAYGAAARLSGTVPSA
jgi:DNA-binding NtrC family response regulator